MSIVVLRSVAFGVLLSLASIAQAQEVATRPPKPADVGDIMSRLRRLNGPEDAAFFLRSAWPRASREFKSELADSLVQESLKVEDVQSSQSMSRSAHAAAVALGMSGEGVGSGLPFDGAAARLRTVAMLGNALQSEHAIVWLSHVHDRQAAVRELAVILRLPDQRAYLATEALLSQLGSEGVAEVRTAFEASEILNAAARSAAAASERAGWPTPAAGPHTGIAAASTPAEDTVLTVPLILGRMRETRTYWLSAEVLRDAGWTSSPQFKAELADSLVSAAIVIDEHGRSPESAMQAAQALGLSGIASGPGTPFYGAAVRVQRLALIGNHGQAMVAMRFLLNSDDPAIGVRMLGEMAALPDDRGLRAVLFLLQRSGPAGIAEARRAFEAGEIGNATARLAAAEAVSSQQTPKRAPSAAVVMASLRVFGSHEQAVEVLRGAGWTSTPEEKQDLADSLTQQMLEVSNVFWLSESARVAGRALGFAGASSGPGTAYATSAHLRRVIEAGNGAAAVSALRWFGNYFDREEAVRQLGAYARVPDGRAVNATQFLLEMMGAEGEAEVRRAFEAGQMRNESARANASERARSGWRAPR